MYVDAYVDSRTSLEGLGFSLKPPRWLRKPITNLAKSISKVTLKEVLGGAMMAAPFAVPFLAPAVAPLAALGKAIPGATTALKIASAAKSAQSVLGTPIKLVKQVIATQPAAPTPGEPAFVGPPLPASPAPGDPNFIGPPAPTRSSSTNALPLMIGALVVGGIVVSNLSNSKKPFGGR